MPPIDEEMFEEVQPNIVVGHNVVIGADAALGTDRTVFTAIDPSGHVITVSSEDVFHASAECATER